MSKGTINAAMNILTNNMKSGELPLNDQKLSQLVQKHLDSKKKTEDIPLCGLLPNIYPVRFHLTEKEMVRKAAIKTKGESGPFGMDTVGCNRISLEGICRSHQIILCKRGTNK